MIVFLDFEASSLGKKSFPIEVAWVFQDGKSCSLLIRPAEDWTDWSAEAEALHGISRAELKETGVPVEIVAARMMRELHGHMLYASAPSWDGKWLSVLLRGAGLPRHALRLKKSDEAFADAARLALGTDVPARQVEEFVEKLIAQTQPEAATHRALPDAMLELDRWKKASATSGEHREPKK